MCNMRESEITDNLRMHDYTSINTTRGWSFKSTNLIRFYASSQDAVKDSRKAVPTKRNELIF